MSGSGLQNLFSLNAKKRTAANDKVAAMYGAEKAEAPVARVETTSNANAYSDAVAKRKAQNKTRSTNKGIYSVSSGPVSSLKTLG